MSAQPRDDSKLAPPVHVVPAEPVHNSPAADSPLAAGSIALRSRARSLPKFFRAQQQPTAATRPRTQFVLTLLASTGVSVGLFAGGAYRNRSGEFAYLIWNLLLAWMPLLFTAWLLSALRRKRWSALEPLAASLLWLLFLPNTFYMVSDFIHLQDIQRVDILYDAVMFTSFIFVGVALGISSVYLVHRELQKRLSKLESTTWLTGIFLLCSFAIYLGRDLRWNSWDVLTNPGGLLFDVSDRLLHPRAYSQMFLTIMIFFVLIASMYSLAWRAARLLGQLNSNR